MQNRWFVIPDKTLIQLIKIKFIGIVFVSMLLSACAYRSDLPVTTQASILPVSDSREIPDAIKDLLNQADQKYMQGDYQGSIATLERAIRINPRYPEICGRS